MKYLGSILILIHLLYVPVSGQINYPTFTIADSLKENANAVIRISETKYERSSVAKYSELVHIVVTVLNSDGFGHAILQIPYDGFSKVSEMSGNIYDTDGNLIKRIKKKDFTDFASNSSFTLYSDHRVKYHKPLMNKAPFTVEYKYTVEHDGIVGLPTWIPHEGYHMAVEEASLNIVSTPDLPIRYKELNHEFNSSQKSEDGKNKMEWTVQNLPAIKNEPYAPTYLEIFPAVLLAPEHIYYDGYFGNFTNWESYGNWCNQLIEDRDELSLDVQAQIQELTANIENDKSKVKAIYEYMQGKTRYVNIALGIGGFQPKYAEEVHEKGYGDCKALSNYTKTLLSAVGIKSHYTEIGNGANQKILFPDFPSANQTNHVILFVPLASDTIWLECTSQNIPFGYIGQSNANRYALVIKENGGELVKTPKFDAEENIRYSSTRVNLIEGKRAKISMQAGFQNNMIDQVHGLIQLSPEDQRKWLLHQITESFDLENLSITDVSAQKPKVSLALEGAHLNYYKKAGKRIIFQPLFIFDHKMNDFEVENRVLPIHIPVGYTYQDSLSIQIPEDYDMRSIPENQELKCVIGDYSIAYEQHGKELLIVRHMTIFEGQYDHEDFEEIGNFVKAIGGFDRKKLVLEGGGP